ncbi:exported hypothetical protein [Tenacibaculum sediminilitoris]|uniref:hypothetical protein n=1 Tax=Tenacibaculum sediminilitoris TaxID=1820334 RepID=UPI003893447F
MYCKIKKTALLIAMVFSMSKMFGQTPEYAYLLKTEIVGSLHANGGNTYIGTLKFDYFASAGNVGKVYFDFVDLNSFSSVKVKVYNSAIRLGTYPDCEYTKEETVLKENFNSRGVLSFEGCSFQQTVYPLHIDGATNTGDGTPIDLCTTSTIMLKGGYDWDFQIGTNGWIPLASAKTSITVNIGDLYASEGLTIDGQSNLRFRTGHRASGKYVATRTHSVTTCSPEFIEYYNTMNTTCSYLSDGKISLKINRELDPSEQLAVTLFKEDSSGDILIGQYSTKQLSATDPKVIVLDDLGGGYYGFKWPGDIDAGTYYFRYQTLNESITPSKPDASDLPYWDKLVKTPNFNIKKAINIDFTAVRLNDENCFEKNDGQIQVEVTSREIERSYLYTVYKVDGTTETLERNWTSFSGSTTVISGLGKGKYKIKVKDSRGCLAK